MSFLKDLKGNIYSEKCCLQIVLIACVVIAIFSIAAGFFAHSNALLLDGVLSFIDVIISVVTLYILKLVSSEPTEEYPFGHFKIEPFVIIIQASMIVASCFFGVLHSVKGLLHHESYLANYGWGFAYTLFTIGLDGLMCGYIAKVNKTNHSDLLLLELVGWKNGFVFTVGLFFGFLIAYYLSLSSNPSIKSLAIYVDPLMTVVIALMIVKEPYQLFRDNFYDLLDKKPKNMSISNPEVFDIAFLCANELHLNINPEYFKLRKAGRAFFGQLCYGINPDISFEKIAQLNLLISNKLNEKFYKLSLEFKPIIQRQLKN